MVDENKKRLGRRLRGTVAVTTNVDACDLAAVVQYYASLGIRINCSQIIARFVKNEAISLSTRGLITIPTDREYAVSILRTYGVAMQRKTEIQTLHEAAITQNEEVKTDPQWNEFYQMAKDAYKKEESTE